MLSDAEQRRLAAIEARLCTEDPGFAQQFTSGWEGQPRDRSRAVAASMALAVAVAAAGIGLVLGSVAAVVIALTTIGATAGSWINNHRRPPVLASAVQTFVALAVILFVAYGIQAVGILIVVAVLVARFFARRYLYAHLRDHHEGQGDRID
jgi:hypothetical protein